jgi:hypothetical protein
LRDFAADGLAVRTAVPFASLERRVAERPTPLTPVWRWITLGGAGLAALAALVLVVPRSGPPRTEAGPLRIKGDIGLDFVVKRGAEIHDGRDGERMRAGDTLRFRYDAGGLPYVLIVGVDADGKVFPYVSAGDRSAPAAKGAVVADGAIQLDADPRPERVFAVYSHDPIGVDEVKPAVRDGLSAVGGHVESLATLPGFDKQLSILLNKAAP